MMGNFLSTTTILNNVYSGGTLGTIQSTAEVFNAIYDTSANALKVNITGFSGGTISGTSGTSGIDGLSGATGADGTSGIDGTSGTSGIDGVADLSGIADTSFLINNAGSVSGYTGVKINTSLGQYIFDSTGTPTYGSNTNIFIGGNGNTISGEGSAVFGRGNRVNSYNGFACGINNTVNGRGLMFGRENSATNLYSGGGGYGNHSTGSYDWLYGWANQASGAYNILFGRNNNTTNEMDCAIGYGNKTTASGGLVNNLFGAGLEGGFNENMTAVGYGNSGITGLSYLDGVMFQVGCGSGTTIGAPSYRRNGFTVYRNMNAEFGGDVQIAGNLTVDGTSPGGVDLSGIADKAILLNNAGSVSGSSSFYYDDVKKSFFGGGATINSAPTNSMAFGTSSVVGNTNNLFSLGYQNNVAGNGSSYTLGRNNTINVSNSFIYGMYNNITAGNVGQIILGGYNNLEASNLGHVMIVGDYNTSTNVSYLSGVYGFYNTLSANWSEVYGKNNSVAGTQQLVISSGSTIGNDVSGATILGGADANISNTVGTTWINPRGTYSGYTSGDTIIDGDTYFINDPIVTDTVTGTKYRIQVTSGVLGIVEIV